MKNCFYKNKFLSIVVAFAIILSSTFSYAEEAETPKKDYAGHWAAQYIERVLEEGYMSLIQADDESAGPQAFMPDSVMTRAMFVEALAEVADYYVPSDQEALEDLQENDDQELVYGLIGPIEEENDNDPTGGSQAVGDEDEVVSIQEPDPCEVRENQPENEDIFGLVGRSSESKGTDSQKANNSGDLGGQLSEANDSGDLGGQLSEADNDGDLGGQLLEADNDGGFGGQLSGAETADGMNEIPECSFQDEGPDTVDPVNEEAPEENSAYDTSKLAEKFTDIDGSESFAAAAAWAVEMGIVNGSGDQFLPDLALDRETLAVLMFRTCQALNVEPESDWSVMLDFDDIEEVDEWAVEGIAFCCMTGLMTGNTDGTFAPKRQLSRAEAAVVLVRFADCISHYSGEGGI